MHPFRPLALFCSILLLATPPVAAQLAPLTVPKGLLRLDFGGRFDNWDRRYLDGERQDAAGDFIRNPLDGGFLPALALDQTELRRVTGVEALTLSLGKSSSSMLVNVGTANLGAAYGVTRRLTLFGNVPIVRVRVQNRFGLDTTEATAGFNPSNPVFGNPALGARTATFLAQFLDALSAISSNLSGGVYDADPAKKALAQETLARGTTLQGDLEELFAGATFLPLDGSAAAGALLTPIEAIRTTIASLGVAGFTESPALPSARVGDAAFEDYVTRPEGPIAGLPFQVPILQYLGDVEIGAAYAWLDHRPARGLGIRSVLQGTVRLRTGKLDRPDDFFDLGTGEGQPDLQGDLVTDLAAGGFGARLSARYVYQFPGRQARRLSPPDQPIAFAALTADVERDPGEIMEVGVEPYLRIAPTLALLGGIRRWSKSADTYRYAQSQAPIDGTSPEVLALGSKANGTVVSLGLSLAHDGRRKDGTTGLPMDASLRWEKVVGSTLGRVAAKESVVAGIRFYRRLF
ncbi:MAG TPA: hypothetical protein VF187_07135 [Gemmatimonadales bacterium]